MELDYYSLLWMIVIVVLVVIVLSIILACIAYWMNQWAVSNDRTTDKIDLQPDILILGGGTAGCVLARRLADKYPDKKIMVLERGEDLRHDRNVYRTENAINIAYTPPYSEVIPSERPGVVCSVASMYGGGSSHNFGLVVQGTRELYEKYWFPKLNMNNAELSAYFQRIYSTIDILTLTPILNPLPRLPSLAMMGLTQGFTPIKEGIDVFLHLGPLRADDTLTRHMMVGFRHASPDVPIVDDYNAEGVINGVCASQRLYVDPVNGVRASVNRQYLPDGYCPKNLHLISGVHVDSMDPKSLEVRVGNHTSKTVKAREKTVLCMGGILSPYFLLKSGFDVGTTDLVNHYGTQVIFAIKGITDFSSGPLAFLPGTVEPNETIRRWQIITSGSILTNFPFLQQQGVDVDGLKREGYLFVTFLLFLLYPVSRGRVYVKEDGGVGVDLNLFDNDTDNDSIVEGMRCIYSNYEYLSTKYEIRPVFPSLGVWTNNDSKEMLAAAKTGVVVSDHYSCILSKHTDANFQLHGHPNLHVVDASTFPHITDGNTQFPAMLIGEIAAEKIMRNE